MQKGDNAYFDFYDADEWERLEIGVFSPEYDNVLTDERRKVRAIMLQSREIVFSRVLTVDFFTAGPVATGIQGAHDNTNGGGQEMEAGSVGRGRGRRRGPQRRDLPAAVGGMRF